MNLPEPPAGLWGWILGAISLGVTAVFSVLTKAMYIMYKEERISNAKAIVKLEAKLEKALQDEDLCRRQHEELAVAVGKLQTRLEYLEKCR